MLTLKSLSKDAIPSALARAERYRLLNEPEQAESICEDVLRAEPSNQPALVILILALTDQFSRQEPDVVTRAQALVKSLGDGYARTYYAGLVSERRARALLRRGAVHASESAGEWLREAMELYERAEGMRPAGNDDALLRWNACARLLARHPHAGAEVPEAAAPLMLE
jgi:hypothetical protein